MQFDCEVDVLVVGSGNGGLTAAICSHDMTNGKVLVVEKSDYFGGTSALSGGGVWVPNNRYAKAAGAKDSFEEAYQYLCETIPEAMIDHALVKTYLSAAPEMVDYLHNHTHVEYTSLEKYPDYYTNLPGAKEGHRSMEPVPINLSKLGKSMHQLLPGGVMYSLDKYAITQVEAQQVLAKVGSSRLIMLKQILRYYLDIPWLLKRKTISRRTTGGAAGVVRLMLSLKERNIPLWLNSALQELIINQGRVIGAVINQQGNLLRIKANRGVILAAGGFEHNQTMREQYLPQPTNHRWSAGCKTNTGDAIKAAAAQGAQLHLMNNAWWCTTKVMPDKDQPFLSITSKSFPGSIVVNKNGQRFSNESQNYMAFLKETFSKYDQGNPCIPMYMLFDKDFRKKRAVWPAVFPDKMLPESYFTSGFMATADTLDALAKNLDIDANGLQQTVERFNSFVESGKDEDFGRGDSAYDRYYGDPAFKPNPCLGKIQKPPFTAIRLDAGDFGTQGGLKINSDAQVLNQQGEPIAGLYACGNCTAAVLPTYPGPGATLGPAMTFAYLAAKHVAEY